MSRSRDRCSRSPSCTSDTHKVKPGGEVSFVSTSTRPPTGLRGGFQGLFSARGRSNSPAVASELGVLPEPKVVHQPEGAPERWRTDRLAGDEHLETFDALHRHIHQWCGHGAETPRALNSDGPRAIALGLGGITTRLTSRHNDPSCLSIRVACRSQVRVDPDAGIKCRPSPASRAPPSPSPCQAARLRAPCGQLLDRGNCL